jgi:predicted metal-dependent peptidase
MPDRPDSPAGAVDKIAAARVWLLKEKPFFGVLARALTIEPHAGARAFRLHPDDRLVVPPRAVLELPFAHLCGRLAHIALHAALGGFARRGARDEARWNVAHDLAIDPLVRGAGLGAGLPLVSLDLPPGSSAEEVFPLLPEQARPEDEFCDLCDTREPEQRADPDDAGGQDAAGDVPARSNISGNSSATVETQARALAWKMRLTSALEEERASGGKTWGDIPGWLEEMIRIAIEPPPSWTVVLQRSISSLTRTDRTWLRPSRRMSALAAAAGDWPDLVVMPGRKVVLGGQLCAVLDTSGSIDQATLGRFVGALASAAAAEDIEHVRLLQADSEVVSDEILTPAELLAETIRVRGRGGTSFIPALGRLIEEARRSVERFSVVYLTDLDGMLPRSRDARVLDVLWVVPHQPRRKPPFGTVVEMR